jgi:hypothetical protein
MEWQPIETTPDKPMPVVYFFGNLVFRDHLSGEIIKTPSEDEPYRDERFQVGFWDGEEWAENGTGHDVFECWKSPDCLPTHWAPITPPQAAE